MILNYYPSYKEYYVPAQYSGDEVPPPTRTFTHLNYSHTGSVDDLYWVFCNYSGVSYSGMTLTNNDMVCYNDIYTYTIEASRGASYINEIEIFVHIIRDDIPIGDRYTPVPLSYYVDGKDHSPKVSISIINIYPTVSFTVTVDPTSCITGEGFIVHIGVCIFYNPDGSFWWFGSAKAKTGKK